MSAELDPLPTPAATVDTAPQRGPFVWFRNQFLAGLAVIIPIMVTYWILKEGYLFLHEYGNAFLVALAVRVNFIAGSQVIDPIGPAFKWVSNLVGILIPVLFLTGLGAMASNVIGARVVATMDRVLSSIPLISSIYRSLKQVIDAFRNLSGKQGFKRVVYVDYPVGGIWMLGFVTGQFYDKVKKQMMTSVFLPCAPSPMTGLLVVVEPDKISDAPISIEDAMKMILSGGLIGPDSGPTARVPLPPMPAPVPSGETVYANLPTADDTMTQPVPAPQLPTGGTGARAAQNLIQGWIKSLQQRFIRS